VRFIPQRPGERVKVLTDGPEAIAVTRQVGEGSAVAFDDGSHVLSTCVNCPTTPCIRYRADELGQDTGLEITYSPDESVCVFDAISDPTGTQTPEIDASACTGCGLCVTRCPVGAIHLTDSGNAAVNTTPNDRFQFGATYSANEFREMTESLAGKLSAPSAVDVLRDGYLAARAATVIRAVRQEPNPRNAFNVLVRNYFFSLGMPAKVGVVGDTSSRVDMVFSSDGGAGIAELEPGEDLLDAIRRLLADTAIAISRAGARRNEILAVIVSGRLPNARSGYYELITDVEGILALRIHTLPLAVLMLANDAGMRIGRSDLNHYFVVNQQNKSLIEDVRMVLRDPSLNLDGLGLTPAK
jgi:Fe-S-cluster-containing hydrogenase component 2